MTGTLVANAQLFFLVFVRIFALVQIAPLLSSRAIPQLAKIGLAFFTSFVVFGTVAQSGYPIPDTGLAYGLLIVGEAMVGIIIGFFLVLIFATFQLAGQVFSLQMGFGASQVFDPMAQVQIPVMGQFLNLVALFVFVSTQGLQRVFLIGVQRSFEHVRAVDFAAMREDIALQILERLSLLFQQAIIIAFPILGTLFLVYVGIGLIGKAAPQMNLLILGFPIAILVAFVMIFLAFPFLVEAFDRVIDEAFEVIARLIDGSAGAGR
jgi:flagellar biosynthetic protein FliR